MIADIVIAHVEAPMWDPSPVKVFYVLVTLVVLLYVIYCIDIDQRGI